MSDLAQAKEVMLKEHLQGRGITDNRVLGAFKEVPREKFVPPQFYNLSYEDSPLDIGSGQTISQPYTVAFMTQLLNPTPSDVVLEVGTGSGYQAAILSRLAKKVYTIERFEELAKSARAVLRKLGYKNVEVIVGDGSMGFPTECAFVPSSLRSKAQIASFENFKFSAVTLFDGIIVTAAAPQISQPLLDQLAVGGRLVVPVGEGMQEMVKITKTQRGFKKETYPGFRFVPLIGEHGFSV